jgi:hypothetical protein
VRFYRTIFCAHASQQGAIKPQPANLNFPGNYLQPLHNKYMNLKAIINSEFVFLPKEASFASCHSSTIVETPTGLLCAWFAGPYEGHPDVKIWLCRQINKSWTNPVVGCGSTTPFYMRMLPNKVR